MGEVLVCQVCGGSQAPNTEHWAVKLRPEDPPVCRGECWVKYQTLANEGLRVAAALLAAQGPAKATQVEVLQAYERGKAEGVEEGQRRLIEEFDRRAQAMGVAAEDRHMITDGYLGLTPRRLCPSDVELVLGELTRRQRPGGG